MTTRKDTEFPVEGGIILRGWLSVLDGNQEKSPSISIALRRRGALGLPKAKLGLSKANRKGTPC
jgi:hypothetical protein